MSLLHNAAFEMSLKTLDVENVIFSAHFRCLENFRIFWHFQTLEFCDNNPSHCNV